MHWTTTGARFFTVDRGTAPQGNPTVYRRIDVATGAILAERSDSPSFFWGEEPAYDRRLGRLFIGKGSTVLALDATTLTEIGRIGAAPRCFGASRSTRSGQRRTSPGGDT